MKIKHIFIALIISSFPLSGYSAEFVIINDTIEYPNATDNNGFYFFYYDPSMPVDWTSPIDYVNGQVYTRYEIISQASSEPVGLQFGIWQLLPPVTGTLYENMESVRILNGPGDFIESNSSPASWWKYNGGVDFTKMNLVWHFGINPYKVIPYNQQIRQENPTVWSERFIYWFPMKVRVTVVAVAKGDQFSGWNNYIKFPTPEYSIDFQNERTNQNILPTDEFSYNPSMVPAFPGSGTPLSIEPGQTIYIRTKARDNTPRSDIQVLTAPERPSSPVFTIDFANLRTNEDLNTAISYSYAADFTSFQNGNGNKLSLTPGSDVYFRISSSVNSFASGIYRLEVPARPAQPYFGVDFIKEQTSELVADSYEYSENIEMNNPLPANGTFVRLTPGYALYFRKKATYEAFASEIQTLISPPRPPAPSFGIDFSIEKISSPLSASYEYAEDINMLDASSGDGLNVPVEPGINMYIRKKASSESFASEIQTLIVPGRPAKPAFTIDFINSQTMVSVSDLFEYSVNANLIDAVSGSGEKVSIGPGDVIYFRQKASSVSFSSEIQELIAPASPAAPEFTIDFNREQTSVAVESSYEYSSHSDMSNGLSGSNIPLKVYPGSVIYFRKKATLEAFASEIQILSAPLRPQSPVYFVDFINEQTTEPVASLFEYSSNPDMSAPVPGSGTPVSLSPGNPVYFRTRATPNDFASEVYELITPQRPVITSLESGSTDQDPFIVTIEFYQRANDFEASDINIENAVVDSFSTIMAVENGTICIAFIKALNNDPIRIQIPPNSLSAGNFRSETFEINYTGKISGMQDFQDEKVYISLSPNPTNGVLRIKSNILNQNEVVMNIYSMNGEKIFSREITENDQLEIDLSFLSGGMYYLQLASPAGSIIERFIIQ